MLKCRLLTSKHAIKPMFDVAEDFSEGLAAVGINGKPGFIDRGGNYIAKPQFPMWIVSLEDWLA